MSIQAFIERWEANKGNVLKRFSEKHPKSYMEVVRAAVEILATDHYTDCTIDPTRIHEINDGDDEGTLLFVIAERGYEPSTYYYVKVKYGSCSGCDTLQSICGDTSVPPTERQAMEYTTLAMHVVQGLRRLGDE